MTYRCKQCNRKTVGVLVQDPENPDEGLFVTDMCSKCLFLVSEEIDKQSARKPPFTCSRCDAKAYSLRNKECVDCYMDLLDVYESMPNSIPVLQPPLGYNLIGCDDMMAEMEVALAYENTPQEEELEN